MTQHPAKVEGFVKTASFNCVGERAESGLLMFGGGRKRKRKRKRKRERWKLCARLTRGRLARSGRRGRHRD